MDELIERARAAAQHSREYGLGTNAPLLDELAAALEAAREDGARLDWLARESIPEGFVHVTSDVYDYACEVAQENGRDEANDADLLAGHRRMIDAARAIDQARGKAGQEVGK